MDELGFDYRLDGTHHIEYKKDEFINEINKAGLTIKLLEINWGEYWAVVK